LTATPSLLQSGGTVQVSWTGVDVTSCTVVGNNGDGTVQSNDTSSPGVWDSLQATEVSSPITQQTTFTLSCIPDNGTAAITRTATVNVIPTFQEI
jgi:hypothetical protein